MFKPERKKGYMTDGCGEKLRKRLVERGSDGVRWEPRALSALLCHSQWSIVKPSA